MTCYGIWGRDWDGIAATGLRELYWRWHNGYHSMFKVNRFLKLTGQYNVVHGMISVALNVRIPGMEPMQHQLSWGVGGGLGS